MSSAEHRTGMTSFFVLWLGQFVSTLGTGLGTFALSVWVLRESGSVTQFALIAFFGTLPALLVTPLAGVLVDRHDRRWIMLLSDVGAALGTLILFALLTSGRLEVWHVYPLAIWMTACGIFQGPAFAASVPMLVPPEQLGRANGMAQLGPAVSGIASPFLAGALFGLIGFRGIILIDLGTFVFAALTLLLIRIPRPPRSEESRSAAGSILSEALFGWRFISSRPGLMQLLIYFAVCNLAFGMAQLLFTPLVLSFATEQTLGTVLSVGGIGTLLGTVAMVVWGGPRRLILGILVLSLVQGLAFVAGGLRASALWVGIAAFGALLLGPIINGSSNVLWQRKVTFDVQGRVFALRRLVAMSTMPLAYLIAGPLVDNLLGPWMSEGGLLADSVGSVLGVGPGRGIGLLFVILGLFISIVTIVAAAAFPRLRYVEYELPDAMREQPRERPPEAEPLPDDEVGGTVHELFPQVQEDSAS